MEGVAMSLWVFAFMLVGLLILTDGIALSRAKAWAYRLGIPLGWREEVLELALPRPPAEAGGLADSQICFSKAEAHVAYYLDSQSIGLLYWGVSVGARNSLRFSPLIGLGVLASGLLEIAYERNRTMLRWRPVLRLGPLLLIGASALAPFGFQDWQGEFVPLPLLIGGAILLAYLAMVWWTLRRLSRLYQIVSGALAEAAARPAGR
jgi:hypothetical protein